MKNGIKINNVSFGYNKNTKQLKNVTLEIPESSFCGITGVNGSGKSTFTLLLNGLIPQEIKGKFNGNVYIDNANTQQKPISYFANKVGMVFQNPDFMLFNLTVSEEIEFGLKNLKLDNHTERIAKALKKVDMEDYGNCDPQTLSFGQKQKICLACILALDSKYIVLDEPTAMLDYKSAISLYELLKSINDEGKTIIIVEHDTDFLKKYASQIAVFDQGQLVLAGTPDYVFSKTEKLQQIGIKIPHP